MTTRQTVTINGPDDRHKIATWARNVEEGTIVEFRKKTRSHEQSAKMHAMLGEVSAQVVWYGQKRSVEDWKNMFTASLRKAQVVPGIDPGTVVPLGIHTSTMTVDEMSNMIEAIYAFGADPEHPVVFKDPKPDDSHSGEVAPSASSEDASASAASSAASKPEGDAPTSSGSTNSNADMIECATEMLKIAALKHESAAERDEAIEQSKAEWEKRLPAELHQQIASVCVSARAVASGKRTPAQARSWLSEALQCSVEALGG